MPYKAQRHKAATRTAPPLNNRPGANARGYTRRWQKASKAYLAEHPLCECQECKDANRLLPATVVHHKEPHRGDLVKFWDRTLWVAMAKRCHDKATAKEDKTFGRTVLSNNVR